MTRTGAERDPPAGDARGLRIDKWLWAARFFRTRSLAARAVEAGQVRVDDARVKPAHPVREGSRVMIRKRELTFDVEVLGSSPRRASAPEAAKLYRETAESAAARARIVLGRKTARAEAAPARPTKRDRRRLEEFLNEP